MSEPMSDERQPQPMTPEQVAEASLRAIWFR